jgi:protein-disulfide isomerase
VVLKNEVVHPDAVAQGHLAACAAAKQGKFPQLYKAWWEKAFKPYIDSRGQNREGMTPEGFMKWAAELGIDAAKLKADMEGPECNKVIQDDMQELAKFNVNGTPAFFINGRMIPGGMAKEQFKELIDEKLKEVEKSGVAPNEYYDKVVMAKGERKFRSKKQPKQ